MIRRTPFSLRARFLLATAAVVLALSLAYGLVAVVGYIVSFDKTAYTLLRGESNLFFSLAQWRNNRLTIAVPPDLDLNSPTLVLIYDQDGTLLWYQRAVPGLESRIPREWLRKGGFYELDADPHLSSTVVGNNPHAQRQLKGYEQDEPSLTHSVVVNNYAATARLPPLSIVVIDTIPQELQRSDLVWQWFSYVLLANLLLVIPLLWLAAHWSLRPIKVLARQIGELEKRERDVLEVTPPQELRSLVRNLNLLLNNERGRSLRYRTTLADLTHSLKTPLAVLQSTLRALRGGKQLTIDEAEPVMLEQISRISQQIGYYLHRASLDSEKNVLTREIHSVSALLDSLCSALNKVYQRKGVVLTLDIPPELTFIGDKNDFMEVMGNLIDNACKYSLEFVEISAVPAEQQLVLVVEDDGPGIPPAKRELIFQRGQRADTLRPGQGIGLAVASEIIARYQGSITLSDSALGGAQMTVAFGRQHNEAVE